MKYTREGKNVEAVKWNGGNTRDVLRLLRGLERTGTVEDMILKLGDLTVEPGQWIIRNGKFITVDSAENFEANYQATE